MPDPLKVNGQQTANPSRSSGTATRPLHDIQIGLSVALNEDRPQTCKSDIPANNDTILKGRVRVESEAANILP
jgi:hypothetical protein